MCAEEGSKAVEKADYTSEEKIFACNHCSMKFSKLINLYKHLHTQVSLITLTADKCPDAQTIFLEVTCPSLCILTIYCLLAFVDVKMCIVL